MLTTKDLKSVFTSIALKDTSETRWSLSGFLYNCLVNLCKELFLDLLNYFTHSSYVWFIYKYIIT